MNEDSSNSEQLAKATPSSVKEQTSKSASDNITDSAANDKIDGKSQKKAIEKTEETLSESLSKSQDAYLYLKAEFDNYKRNTIKERSELIKFGAKNLINDLLEVVDNFDRALEAKVQNDSWEDFKKGIEMTAKNLRCSLEKHGVEEILCQGTPFDPTQHEALSSEETDQIAPGHILRVLKKPYKMHGKVIRPAQVVVAKAKS